MIRPLKWGTLCLWTPTGSKMASRQSWKNERKSPSKYGNPLKTDILLYFQLWRPVIFEPVGVRTHNVPHFKGLIMLYLDFEAQGRGSTFTFCHAHLKKAILLHKMARVPFDLLIAVCTTIADTCNHSCEN